ncbi:aldehyde dehydrogenase (plasmid) [Rhodococcus opacus]|uniref:Aldehyde dehydrogenase n=1 Tax=Rhodococcus opacus TaxID=37919 RepID=A0A1B1KIX4_RHOOP|nr:aldehyde dehydrogenase family protein [Rhodococcus opacus]ANS32566.1 aldehyde dehydrogenase [Rhodococcus opacus]
MTITIAAPSTSDTLDFTSLFRAQKDRFASDATKSLDWRLEQLTRLERLITENQDALTAALAADFKTATFEIAFEFGAALGAIADAKANLAQWMEPTDAPLPATFAKQGYKGRVFHDPYGVTLLIAPFNAPLALVVAPLVSIVAGGNPAIVKPSEVSSHTADTLSELVPHYFEPEDVALVRGDRTVVSALLELPFDFIFFTGSVPVGKIVMRAAAEHLTPVLLELGGHNPSIVDQTANLADAARKLVWGAMAFGGQWCVSPGYVYVHESVADEFVAETTKAVREFYGTDPKANPDLSLIAAQKDVVRLAGLIDPAKVAIGGDVDVEGRYVAPTILYPIQESDKVMEAEIFGPILPVLRYSDLDEVVKSIKERPSGLTAYIFSQDKERISSLLTSLPFGGGAVNQTMLHLMFPSLPFGGVGGSGIGQYLGKAGFDNLTHNKSVLFSPADESIDVVFPPYSESSPAELTQLLSK